MFIFEKIIFNLIHFSEDNIKTTIEKYINYTSKNASILNYSFQKFPSLRSLFFSFYFLQLIQIIKLQHIKIILKLQYYFQQKSKNQQHQLILQIIQLHPEIFIFYSKDHIYFRQCKLEDYFHLLTMNLLVLKSIFLPHRMIL